MSLALKNVMQDSQYQKQTKAHAFIVSMNCSSDRFHFTKQNIQRVFPNFFIIHCTKTIPLNDLRIDRSLKNRHKKLTSSLLSFVTVWTYEIPKYSTNNELEWSFVFEDDVDFLEPSKFSLPNYINAIQELMHHPEIQLTDGMFYLGICGPTYANDNRTLITSFSNNSLLTRRGYGMCTHAMGITTKRAISLWGELSSYIPTPLAAVDVYIGNYCIRSGKHYYILGANMQWPPNTGHHSIAYQDRSRFRSEVW
jgi:hypothetical protein